MLKNLCSQNDHIRYEALTDLLSSFPSSPSFLSFSFSSLSSPSPSSSSPSSCSPSVSSKYYAFKTDTSFYKLLVDNIINDSSYFIREVALKILLSSLDFIAEKEIFTPVVLYNKLVAAFRVELDRQVRHLLLKNLLEIATDKESNLINVSFIDDKSSIKFIEMPLTKAVTLTLGSSICDPCKYIRTLACESLGEIKFMDDIVACALLSKEATEQLPWSFCGSFIVAIEDEFEIVRYAAIEAMQRRSVSKRFALAAIDFLIDSFQDESVRVRDKAFDALCFVYEKHDITIELGQLESILAHLDDIKASSRKAVRALLSTVRMSSEECIIKLIKCLPIAIAKFKNESEEIFACLVKLGYLNSKSIASYVGSLIKSDKYILSAEPKIEDVTYQVRLVLVLSALKEIPGMVDFLPEFIFKHYHFVRAKFNCCPDFFGHSLHERFYECSSFSFLTTRLFGKVGNVEIQKTRLLTELVLTLCKRRGDGDDDLNMIAALKTRIRYNAMEFSIVYVDFLLKILDYYMINRLVGIGSVLLGFEHVSKELYDAMTLLESKGMTETLEFPLPYTPEIQMIKGHLTLLEGNLRNQPIISMTQIPVMFKVHGKFDSDQKSQVFLRAKIPGEKDLMIIHRMFLDEHFEFEFLFTIPREKLSELVMGEQYSIDIELCLGNQSLEGQSFHYHHHHHLFTVTSKSLHILRK